MKSSSSLTLAEAKQMLQLVEKIEALKSELDRLLGGSGSRSGKKTGKGKWNLSAEGREKIAAAQRKRWAKYNSGRNGRTKASAAVKAR